MVASTAAAALDFDGVSRRARASTVPSSSTTPAATFVPPMSTPTARVTAGSRQPGQVGGADEPGVVAERRPGDLEVGSVRPAGQGRGVGLPGRLEQQVARLAHAAAD